MLQERFRGPNGNPDWDSFRRELSELTEEGCNDWASRLQAVAVFYWDVLGRDDHTSEKALSDHQAQFQHLLGMKENAGIMIAGMVIPHFRRHLPNPSTCQRMFMTGLNDKHKLVLEENCPVDSVFWRSGSPEFVLIREADMVKLSTILFADGKSLSKGEMEEIIVWIQARPRCLA